ncbi:MAG: hypothetical protein HY812_06890 [Planctomycetes bacterium]|nr:hypothetical protein [Planctomycetota bacterium]
MRVLRPPLLAAAAFLAGSAPLMGAGTTEFTAGHLFVALKNQGRIVELDRNGSEVRSFGQDKAFNGLWDLCFAPDGRLFASSRNDDRIAAFRADLNGYEETQYVPASGVDGPQGLAFGPGGSLFVASTHLDSVVDVTSGKRYEANPWFANLDGPTGVTLSPDGRLIAAAYFSDNLVEYSLEGHPVSQTSTQSLSGAGPVRGSRLGPNRPGPRSLALPRRDQGQPLGRRGQGRAERDPLVLPG